MKHIAHNVAAIDTSYSPRSKPRLAVNPNHVAVVGNIPPTRCGIATFTADMITSLLGVAPDAKIDVYAMVNAAPETPNIFNPVYITEHDRNSYRAAAVALANSGAEVVWVQHEFGIFGGEAGKWLIDLLTPVAAPIVVTFHTILESPTIAQKHVMDWLIARASRLVTMSEEGRAILERVYNVSPQQIAIIPHGVPDRPIGQSDQMKKKFDLTGQNVLMTFGLLSPGKGLETVISALPAITSRFPNTVYCIAGVTHPKLLAADGDAYRQKLEALAEQLGVSDNIMWVNRYLPTEQLLDLIGAADVYITPYLNAGQSTSGTLSYAVALGKAVISTPYSHATDLLKDDIGILIPFQDPKALETAVLSLFDNVDLLRNYQNKAYHVGRSMTWPAFGRKSLQLIDGLTKAPCSIHGVETIGSDALFALCDDTGMLQHSVFSIGDRAHGYCIDDNARALLLAVSPASPFALYAPKFAAFIQHGWNKHQNRFRNFMGYDRRWCEVAGSDDSCGRTIWAIGYAAAHAQDPSLREWANHLWKESAHIATEFNSPRAVAFAAMGADAKLEGDPDDKVAIILLTHALDVLKRLYSANRSDQWSWFEPYLAYDNCRLPEAMLKAANRLGDFAATQDALSALEWITDQQTTSKGYFRPIGSNAFGKSLLPDDPFDQQAVDAWATVDAAAYAYRFQPNVKWLLAARAAFEWFLVVMTGDWPWLTPALVPVTTD